MITQTAAHIFRELNREFFHEELFTPVFILAETDEPMQIHTVKLFHPKGMEHEVRYEMSIPSHLDEADLGMLMKLQMQHLQFTQNYGGEKYGT